MTSLRLSRKTTGRATWLVLCLCLLSGTAPALFAETPPTASIEPDQPAPWADDFPQVETRTYWAWPEFLSQGRSFSPPGEPLRREQLPSRRTLFQRIDWFTQPPTEPQAELLFPDVDEGFADSFLFADARAPDWNVTLVRGGFPRLFGARGRIRGEYGDEFDDVKRIRGQLLMNLTSQFGIDASVDSWDDDRPRRKNLGNFWTGDANLVYSLGAQRVAMRGGGGAAWIHHRDTDVGYNFTYGADLFLTRPWLISGEVDWGNINKEKLFHWRATFGVELMRFEVYVGYDSYKYDRFRFDGPVAGAGLWF